MQATAKAPFVERHSVASFVLLYVLMMVMYILGGAITSVYKLDTTAQILITNPILVLIALRVTARHHWWEEMGLTTLGQGARPWLMVLLPALFALSRLLDGIHVSSVSKAALFMLCSLLVGLAEEFYFRGLFMRVLKPYGQTAVIVWCTVLFGLTHGINLLAGQGGLNTLVQIVHATAIGFLFSVVRLKSGSIWSLVAVHTLIDFMAWVSQSEIMAEPVITPAMLILPALFSVGYIINGIWLLRAPRHE